MIVAELRKLLDGLPDNAPVVVRDTYSSDLGAGEVFDEMQRVRVVNMYRVNGYFMEGVPARQDRRHTVVEIQA